MKTAVLREAHRRLAEVAGTIAGAAFEFIFVDDGSSDETAAILHELSQADTRVRGLRLSRNFGQQIATTAGLEHAAGDAVVLMDADLQDPPEMHRAVDRALAGRISGRLCRTHGTRRRNARSSSGARNCFTTSSIAFRRCAFRRTRAIFA